MLFSLASCTPKLEGGDKNAEVSGNGSLVVRQGDYIYFVNGMTSEALIQDDAEAKLEPVKGAILRQKINASTGALEGNPETVVKEALFTTYKGGGIYIFDEWIYYVTPNTGKNKSGTMLMTQTLLKRTKIDGSKTKTIATLKDNDSFKSGFEFKVTRNYFFYLDSGKLQAIDLQKNNFKVTTVAEDVTGMIIPKADTYKPNSNPGIFDYVIFTQSSEEEVTGLSHNIVKMTNGTDTRTLISDSAYFENPNGGWIANIKSIYNYSVVSAGYEGNDLIVYLNKNRVAPNNGTEEAEGLFEYRFKESEGYAFKKENAYRVSKISLTAFLPLGYGKGVLTSDSSANGILYYKGTTNLDTSNADSVPKPVKVYGAAVNLLTVGGNVDSGIIYLYYTDGSESGALKRVKADVNNGSSPDDDYAGYKPAGNNQILIRSDVTVSWMQPVFRTYGSATYFYFIYAYDYNYLARIKINPSDSPSIADHDDRGEYSKISTLGIFSDADKKLFDERANA
jgi:hypothetical protein